MIHTFTAPLLPSGNKLWGHHLVVPANIADAFLATGSKRIVCNLNDTAEFQAALTPIGAGRYVVKVNKQLQKKLGIQQGDAVQATLLPDTSKYGLPMPPEFEEVLAQDTEGHGRFHALTPGKQRTLLYIIGQGTDADNRIHRALTILKHLEVQGGRIDFRQLAEDLRTT